ncbi:hypothetical protein ANO11243_046030 [Dothideomycetidae sp. 11243]|nr:hypothetical protein ANO11243_046030 [fungal sp. No.11243]
MEQKASECGYDEEKPAVQTFTGSRTAGATDRDGRDGHKRTEKAGASVSITRSAGAGLAPDVISRSATHLQPPKNRAAAPSSHPHKIAGQRPRALLMARIAVLPIHLPLHRSAGRRRACPDRRWPCRCAAL